MTGFFRATWSVGLLASLVSSTAATDLATLQQNYVGQGYGMFLHYNMGSYTNEEWAHSGLNVNTFNPTASIKADTDQWAATAKAAGMKYGVLTTKHHDGFALWNTDQSAYDVAATSWYNDQASSNYHVDVVKSYADSFRAQGLGVGMYYSISDRNNGIGSKYYSNNPTVPVKSAADATAYVKAELNHLLTSYGQIDIIWADGWGDHPEYGMMGANYVNYAEVSAYIKQISPNTLLLVNAASWNGDIKSYETTGYGMPSVGNTTPSELCDKLAPTWFYNTTNYGTLQAASTVATLAKTLNSRNTTFSLDVTPDRSGAIPQVQINRLNDIKAGSERPWAAQSRYRQDGHAKHHVGKFNLYGRQSPRRRPDQFLPYGTGRLQPLVEARSGEDDQHWRNLAAKSREQRRTASRHHRQNPGGGRRDGVVHLRPAESRQRLGRRARRLYQRTLRAPRDAAPRHSRRICPRQPHAPGRL